MSVVDGRDAVEERLLLEVLEATEPAAALERACAGHPDLSDKLRRMFATVRDLDRLSARHDERTEGEAFGEYRIIRPLGTGMDSVYLAWQARLGRFVALKVICASRLIDPRARARFRREALALSRLDHPAICPVYDSGEVDGTPYLAMRYVPGETLAATIAARSGPTQEPTPAAKTPTGPGREHLTWILALIEKVARALQAAHDQKLIHRDVKPSNILVTPAGEPVLIDFGLVHDEASDHPTLTLAGELVGTPSYMAPEQISRDLAPVDATTDVYSLGVTLYECVTGRCPFQGRTREDLFRQILHEEPSDPRRLIPALPDDLRIVLQAAMEKDPARRYRTAADFAEDLRRVRRREPILARRPGPWRRAQRWGQRNPVVAATLALLLLSQAVILWSWLRVGAADAWAHAKEIEAARHLERLDLVANAVLVRRAREREAELGPPWPARIAAMEDWLEQFGRPLAALVPEIARQRALLAAAPAATASITGGYLRDALEVLAGDLEALLLPETGVVANVERRLAWARTIQARSVDAYAAPWRAAIEAIRVSPRYGGLALAPQVGLIPLGADPTTGLHEFYDLASSGSAEGELPAREPGGGFAVRAETGIVFVLVPGGVARIGSQATDPAGMHFDPDASPFEAPHDLDLAPFLLGKYEVTQAQWARLTRGDRPSYVQRGMLPGKDFEVDTLPVEQVGATRCDAVLVRHGLALPTEAQWEYACRAGSATPWSFGDDARALQLHGNIQGDDADLRLLGRRMARGDGFELPAPVGSFLPNAWGLYDMHGNVSEWCRDHFASYERFPPRAGDGLREPVDPKGEHFRRRITRGGAFGFDAITARSSFRETRDPRAIESYFGLRAARAVQRAD